MRRGAAGVRSSALLLVTALVVGGVLFPVPAYADEAVQQAVDASVAAATNNGVRQSISVVDRLTGENVARNGGEQRYIGESIVKLFTAAYYLIKANGDPDPALSEQLREMIINSDDDIESALWNTDIVPAMAQRYGLGNTSNGPRTGPDDWGWELITADDETQFLYKMSNDPLVAPLITEAMSHEAATAADGFDQHFGLNAIAGDHGSKQGWTDVGSTSPFQVHSVGWTDRYFVAILETDDDADYDSMQDLSTRAAQAILVAENPLAAPGSAPVVEPAPTPTPTTPDAPQSAGSDVQTAPAAAAGPAVVVGWISHAIALAAKGFAEFVGSH